jgi:hypothetical protein
MSAAMVVMNYCSWVPIRRAYSWEDASYARALEAEAGSNGDPGVVDGERIASDLHGLRVMLVAAEQVAAERWVR